MFKNKEPPNNPLSRGWWWRRIWQRQPGADACVLHKWIKKATGLVM